MLRFLFAGIISGLLFFSIGGCSKASVWETRWSKDGPLRERYGVKVNSKGQYIKHGKYESWHKNGEKWKVFSFEGGKRVGPYHIWDDKGTLTMGPVSAERTIFFGQSKNDSPESYSISVKGKNVTFQAKKDTTVFKTLSFEMSDAQKDKIYSGFGLQAVDTVMIKDRPEDQEYREITGDWGGFGTGTEWIGLEMLKGDTSRISYQMGGEIRGVESVQPELRSLLKQGEEKLGKGKTS